MYKATGVYAAALAALMAVAEARNLYQLPRATPASDYAVDGFSPKPTGLPNFPFHKAIQRRAASTSSIETVYVAPDNTCGFISGLAGAGYTCGGGATCVFFTSSTAPGHVACCNTEECNARNVCIDYNGYYSQSKCDNGCAVDTFTLKCTNTALPYCNTISFPGDIMDVFCNNVDITGIQAALTTYRGEASRKFTPLPLDGGASTTSDSTSTTSSPTSSETSSGPDPTTTGGGGGGGKGSGGGGSSNTGAIVGGVVGGVGGLGLIGLAAFFLLRRNKAKSGTHEPVPQVPPNYQSPPVQQTPQGYYDPKFAAAVGQQQYPPQQYPPQQGYYTSPEGQTISPVDPRYSTAPSSTSPAPSGGYAAPAGPGSYQPQENVIHEAPAQSDNHHGQMHELA
ncbi:hypothetical protein HDV57DRAFT_517624 [Trichoderma longibrachiatum]